MRITLSFAATQDGYLDDNTATRLKISTPEDWEAIHALRSRHDAILIGAETLRRDNPTLKGVATKVVVSRSGKIDPQLRLFQAASGRILILSEQPIPALDQVAEVIVARAPLTAARIVTELERRRVERLLVEGGAQILRQFIEEGLADEIRKAVNPAICLGEALGSTHFRYTAPEGTPTREEDLGGMQVTHYTLQEDCTVEDLHYLQAAIEASRNCPICATCYRVGAVIRTTDGTIYTGYTHETSPTHHAEQEAILKALHAGADLHGATIYTSMEPCSKRASEPESCTDLILRYGFSRVVFAAYEPSKFVCCEGACTLRSRGVAVRVYSSLANKVLQINNHLF